MNIELQEKIKAKYPMIFDQNFYFECDDGWYNILDLVCYKVQSYIEDHAPKVDQIKATQVKEKFGGLRFYYNGGDEFVDKLIREAEAESVRTCETCGEPGGIKTRNRWMVCRCSKCPL